MNFIFGGSKVRAVESKPNDEDPLVHRESDPVCGAAVAPARLCLCKPG